MKETIDYLATLDEATLHGVVQLMAGIAQPDFVGCDPAFCHDTSGCTPGTKNGYCACVHNVCTWVPAV